MTHFDWVETQICEAFSNIKNQCVGISFCLDAKHKALSTHSIDHTALSLRVGSAALIGGGVIVPTAVRTPRGVRTVEPWFYGRCSGVLTETAAPVATVSIMPMKNTHCQTLSNPPGFIV